MKPRVVAKIVMDPSARLFVVPALELGDSFEHIYREANGLRWHRDYQAIYAHEPQRWEPEELLHHIAATVRGAFGEELQVTDTTKWEGVSQELQASLRSTLAAAT